MPARLLAHVRRSALVTLAMTGTAVVASLVAVAPAQASVPIERGPSLNVVITPVPAPVVKVAPVVTAATKVLAYAASLRGRPYSYGAAGPSAFDCSGYTSYVFAHAVGRTLAHSSATQYANSIKIAKSAIRPGDLVFFTSGGRVYHVGIYAGGGLIWNAPHTGTVVRIETISTSSWVAGRVL